jgi:hypothetical protein
MAYQKKPAWAKIETLKISGLRIENRIDQGGCQ